MKRCPGCAAPLGEGGWHCSECGYEPSVVDGLRRLAPALDEQVAGYDPAHFEHLAGAEAQHFWFRSRAGIILDAIRRHAPALDSYLEIGCGTGLVLERVATHFPQAEVVGSEVLAAGLRHLRARLPAAELLQMDAHHIPYRDHFSVIGAYDVIEHIEDDTEVLRQVRAALAPGGLVVLTVPQHPWLWSRFDELAGHERRYTRKELRARLVRAGFEVVYAGSFVFFLLPALWLKRRASRPGQGEMADELAIHPLLNRLFRGLMRIERRLIAAGFTLPAGGSLLVVARRVGA